MGRQRWQLRVPRGMYHVILGLGDAQYSASYRGTASTSKQVRRSGCCRPSRGQDRNSWVVAPVACIVLCQDIRDRLGGPHHAPSLRKFPRIVEDIIPDWSSGASRLRGRSWPALWFVVLWLEVCLEHR